MVIGCAFHSIRPGLLYPNAKCWLNRSRNNNQFSRESVERLKGFGARPWVGREITKRWLARQLRPYGVRPRTMRIGEEVANGYCKTAKRGR